MLLGNTQLWKLFIRIRQQNAHLGGVRRYVRRSDVWKARLSDKRKFEIWLKWERSDTSWLSVLPKFAPPKLCFKNGKPTVPQKYQKEWGEK